MTIALLSIGTELVRGEIDNTNASWLCQRIVEFGAEVVAIETVPDDPPSVVESLQRLAARADLVITTGGLGPTTDDLTNLCVAQALGVPLVRDPEGERIVRQRYAERGRTPSEFSLKQADLPQGATLLDNELGTAPGFRVTLGRAQLFFFPGVPREMKPMFEHFTAPEIRRQVESGSSAARAVAQVRLRTFGAPEAQINDQLTGIEQEFNVTLGYRTHFPEIDVKAIAARDTLHAAQHAARAAADAVRARLGPLVYAEGNTGIAEAAAQALRAKGWSFGLAESCTGGLVSALVTESSCSDYFRGAVVCYANDVKEQVLGVSRENLTQHGAVSQVVAEELAQGARRVLDCDVALAFTGIAGPSGGTSEKPVGLVHYAVAFPGGVVSRHGLLASSSVETERLRIQRRAAFLGLALVREVCPGARR